MKVELILLIIYLIPLAVMLLVLLYGGLRALWILLFTKDKNEMHRKLSSLGDTLALNDPNSHLDDFFMILAMWPAFLGLALIIGAAIGICKLFELTIKGIRTLLYGKEHA